MSNFCRTCDRFAEILGAKVLSRDNDVCTVMFMRNIRAEILGRRTQSPLALPAMFSFECPDNNGRTLNLGETVILQDEINNFITELRLMYIHFESIDRPLDFAIKVAEAFRVLRR